MYGTDFTFYLCMLRWSLLSSVCIFSHTYIASAALVVIFTLILHSVFLSVLGFNIMWWQVRGYFMELR